MYEDLSDIYHHGVKGMKWGVRRTPEQLGYKPKPKKTKVTPEEKQKKKLTKRQQKEALKNFRAKSKFEKEREQILRSPSKLYKNRDKFTKEEIDAAMRRFKWEQELRNMSKSDMNRGKEYLDMILGYTESGMKAYNTVARLYNTFGGAEEKNKMKLIPSAGGGDKQNKPRKN